MQINQATSNRILEIMAKESQFARILSSDIMKPLTEDLFAIIEEKVKLVITFKAEDYDKAMLRVCLDMLERWNSILRQHEEHKTQFAPLVREMAHKVK